MIVLVTDFGLAGPYIGQLLRVLHQAAPSTPVINLFADAPKWDPKATSYLLPAYRRGFPDGSVFLCIVDPGVGSFQSPPAAVRCDGHWFVGPDNGLFEMVRRDARAHRNWHITWRPAVLSASFHGRDLYAPIAANLRHGRHDGLTEAPAIRFPAFPDQLLEVIYVDHYGNAITGIRGDAMSDEASVACGEHRFRHARTFAAAANAAGFWYVNSNGLVEIAANRASAAALFGLTIGQAVTIA